MGAFILVFWFTSFVAFGSEAGVPVVSLDQPPTVEQNCQGHVYENALEDIEKCR